MAFYYVLMHLAVWLVLDRQLAWAQIVEDLTKRPYIIVGMAAALLLTPLALTSSNAALRRLGPLVVAADPPAGLSGHGAGGDPLRLAGEGLAARAAALRRGGGGAAGLPASCRGRCGPGAGRPRAAAPEPPTKICHTRAFSACATRRADP